MIDRTQFAAQGLAGGRPGATGALFADDQPLQPKRLHALASGAHITHALPGGGGYGEPWQRDPQRVLSDVIDAYVSLEAAARDYGVVIRYMGKPDQLVRLPEHYLIDEAETQRLRHKFGGA